MTDDGIFLRNSWYVAAWNHELIDGKKLARTILERPVVIYRGESGKVVALDDRCCHRAAPLSMGRIEGDDIRCMYHGMKFDPSGKCIQIPGQDMIPAKLGVRSYPVVERYNLIWIWMGEAEKADPNLIVDHRPHAGPRHLPARHHVRAGRWGRGERRCRSGNTAIPQRPVHDTGDAQLDAFLLELSARFRHRQPEHRAVAAPQPRSGVQRGSGDHRGAAEGVRRRSELSAARNRRRRGIDLFPLGTG